MADVTLKNGREVIFDLASITMREWRDLRNPAFSNDKDDAILAKVSGLPIEELQAMAADEYKRLLEALVNKMRDPLASPN